MQSRVILWVCVAVFYFAMAALMAGCASASYDGPPQSEFHIAAERQLDEFDMQEIQCLAVNVYHEARGEPIRGQEAVALVVRNRVAEQNRPDTICGVVYERNRRGCQFSWTCDGRPDRIRDEESFSAILERMQSFYVENPIDFTGGANYYHASYVRPSWSRVFHQTMRVGTHIFYRG